MTSASDRVELLAAVEKGLQATANNSRKWTPLKEWFQTKFPDDVMSVRDAEGKNITEEKQVWNRIHNELAGRDPKYAVITAVDPALLPRVLHHLKSTHYPRARAFLLLDGLTPVELQIYQPDGVTSALEAMFPELTAKHIKRVEHSPPPPPPTAVAVPIVVDDRILRMLILAIRSSQAVMLVGPPGTGKTTLLNNVIDQIREAPASFGFSGVNPPILATPEESWTTMDLLGGQTLDEDGELRFRPGLVLEAIREDRWLILDEANRADLDRIFGGLLTWLSVNVEVDLGPVSTHVDADRVTLGWASGGESQIENQEALSAPDPTGDPVRYLAGDQWRLLGTYNAADAQRVFRWGQALGRRFSRVPVPAPEPDDFAESILALTSDLPEVVHDSIVDLYAAHHDLPAARVGPALFLPIQSYVEHGLIGSDTDEELILKLLAEAYLLNVGTRLSKLRPEDLDLLQDDIVNVRKVFSSHEWTWILDKVEILG